MPPRRPVHPDNSNQFFDMLKILYFASPISVPQTSQSFDRSASLSLPELCASSTNEKTSIEQTPSRCTAATHRLSSNFTIHADDIPSNNVRISFPVFRSQIITPFLEPQMSLSSST